MPCGDGGLGWVMLLPSLLQWGKDQGDPHWAKESDLTGFMGTGVPWAAHGTGWRHEARNRECRGV